MQTTNYNMPDALRRMKEQSLVIPQFQRSFTWRESQVKLLVDSLARSYPIGSVLLLPKKNDFPLAYRSIDAVIRDGYPPDELINPSKTPLTEIFYVLDGQQRLTSVARVFLNSHPKQTYYFDLKAILDYFPKEETNWVVSRARSRHEPERKDRNRLLRTDIILDQAKADIYVSEYVEDSEDFSSFDIRQKREMSARIKGVFECMRNYQIPVVILDNQTGIESICRVFETINSTGTRLTTFDLAVARFFPDPDLRHLWTEVLERYPRLMQFDVDGERILQLISLLRAGETSSYAEPSRSDLLALPKPFMIENWDRAARSLNNAYEWAEGQGARPETLPNHGLLVAVAAYRSQVELVKNIALSDHEAVLRRWYFCKTFQKGARQAANYKIGQDFTELVRYTKTGTLPSFQRVEIDWDDFLSMRKSEVRYKSIQCLLATTLNLDIITGKKITSDVILEDHHIFPRSNYKNFPNSSEQLIDSIANRMVISREGNRELGDRQPLDYFGELLAKSQNNGTTGDLVKRLSDSFIPGDPRQENWLQQFSLDNFDEFCKNRAKLIITRLRDVVGDAWQPTPKDDLSSEE